MHHVDFFKNEASLKKYASQLAKCIESPCLIFLSGDLGAGKTTFVRGFLRGFGFYGAVKSPTFTLVEEYHLQDRCIYHFDFYRIHDPEELEGVGFRDYLRDGILLIEWPECALCELPTPDLFFHLAIVGSGRNLEVKAASKLGERILNRLG